MIVNLKQKLFAESHDSENFETFDTNIEKLINITNCDSQYEKKGLADFLSAVLTFIWFGLWTGLKITDKNADFLCLRVVFLKGVEHIDLRKLAELKSRRSQDGLACSIRRVTEMAWPSGWQARDARTPAKNEMLACVFISEQRSQVQPIFVYLDENVPFPSFRRGRSLPGFLTKDYYHDIRIILEQLFHWLRFWYLHHVKTRFRSNDSSEK